ncbi:MAG TPA: M14-type cytosolic carboxypeptidase [Aquella sp.]|nr:M14-type cytosolic carboxypeptidase [Aquella sp.]
MIIVNSKFDGGSITPVDISNPEKLNFKIRNDTNSHFAQWFYFQLSNIKDKQLNITFSELSKTAYPDGWKNYSICASYDNEYWFRIPTNFDGDNLTFSITPDVNTVYFAYFEPYSYAQHMRLIGYANQSELVKHEIIGETNEGRNIDLLIAGNPKSTHKIWIMARQHPGETMAEWFMEGLIHRLLDEQDSVSRTLLQNFIFYLVPNMNPDGAYNGNLRVNSVGSNLNREWLTPSLERSPEVYYVRQKMMDTGVDIFFDIHGDEAIPYVFTSGCEHLPSYSEKQKNLDSIFKKYMLQVNPDYQTKFGYEKGQFKDEEMTLATCWIGDHFDCFAQTIEMPFKDNDNLPDKLRGWNGNRSYLFGQSLLTTINLMLN